MFIALSIIVPTLNRANYLEKILESIKSQNQKTPDWEVIVIDNGSTDNTKQICLSYHNKIKNLRYYYDDEPGLLTGRHKGIELASADIICFLDDDIELNPNYVNSVIELFNTNTNINFATGPCIPKFEIEPPNWLPYFWNKVPEGKYCAWLSLLYFGDSRKIISPNYVWGLNFCCRKNTIIKLGGFNPDCIPKHLQMFQGDGETGLTQKAINANMKAIYEPQLSLSHHVSKERLTHEYFKKWAFYKGVCDSYSQLRHQHFYQPDSKQNKIRLLRNKVHPYYRWIKNLYKNNDNKNKLLPESIKNLQCEIEISTQEGYQFHQNYYYSNQKVKSWVLKENYWDYKLPIDA